MNKFIKNFLNNTTLVASIIVGFVLTALITHWLGIIVGLVVMLPVAFVISHWITHPINLLTDATRQLLKSNYNDTLQPSSETMPREISALYLSLADMLEGANKTRQSVTQLNQSLQERIEEATLQLRQANEKLEMAAHEADQASRAKSSFLANMSHELRTPMNAIIGYSQILEEDANHNNYTELLPDIRKIQNASKHLLALISDILDLSKIEAGKMEMHLETFNLENLIREVSSTIEPLADNNHNEFEVHLTDKIGDIYADITKLKQILFNLLSNAFKFTHHGRVSLDVKKIQQGNKDMVQFQVKDTGIGISHEQLQNLFTEFTQADTTTTRKYGGTGLGLAISRFFAHMMNGEISVESQPNQGSTFTLIIPLQVDLTLGSEYLMPNHSDLPTAEEFRYNQSGNWNGVERRKKITTVLIVDSDPYSREVVERILRQKGFNTRSSGDVNTGIELAKKFHPNIITMEMPARENWQVLEEIKKDAHSENVPILILTMMQDDGSSIEKQGSSAFLTKPVSMSQLETMIGHLARRRGRRKTDSDNNSDGSR